ncbi:allantoinase AllB [Ornithinimicrobium pekingense]|uniref:allantoinase n=1 Tax=Ornithinimicrobium pekingense TaxID=384677 RepID=A0ABQ2F7N2_9MICO|nr:allantoinase AllB [Ornithinimicrobium pekingense]GGK69941.1 allantoinase [Ornithinimicrobium pekingense]
MAGRQGADLDLVVRARRAVVDGRERPAVVGVRAGRVVLLEVDAAAGLADVPPATEVVALADDEVLLPGLVDTHVHVNEPGRTEWEGFASATRAAAAGGVTTVVDMPLNSIPPTVTVAALREKQEAARDQAWVDVGFWGGAVPGHLRDLEELHAAGVMGFKCFLADSGVEEFPHLDAATFARAMAETARLGALMVVHAEDAEALRAAAPASRLPSAYADFLASRPATAEVVAVQRVVDEARRTGGRAHVPHLSAADALPVLRAAREAGADVTVETCPHYLTLAAETVPPGATELKCCPPIRERSNQDRLWTALEEGVVDMVVTDHSPSTVDLKHLDTGDFATAWGGISSLQLGLPTVWTEARRRGIPLASVVRWMATAPADRVGLTTKGRLRVGADADLVVLAPEEEWQVDVAALHHRNPVCAYAGHRLTGRVRRTWLRGTPVTGDGPPLGRLLQRGHP